MVSFSFNLSPTCVGKSRIMLIISKSNTHKGGDGTALSWWNVSIRSTTTYGTSTQGALVMNSAFLWLWKASCSELASRRQIDTLNTSTNLPVCQNGFLWSQTRMKSQTELVLFPRYKCHKLFVMLAYAWGYGGWLILCFLLSNLQQVNLLRANYNCFVVRRQKQTIKEMIFKIPLWLKMSKFKYSRYLLCPLFSPWPSK